MGKYPTTGIRLTPEDLALLEALCAAEQRTKGDILRRSLRMYAAANPPGKAPRKKR